jgi:hypothetical protein
VPCSASYLPRHCQGSIHEITHSNRTCPRPAGQPGRWRQRGPSQEQLATVPGLTTAQQDAIYRIENDRRAAHEALLAKERPAHKQIEEQATQKLRAALGDEAYANYAAWKLEHRGERRHGRHQRMRDRNPDAGAGAGSEPSDD